MADWVVPEAGKGGPTLPVAPTFSVVIPVYQGAHIVSQAIESVLDQTVAPCEILVCDDGSTDDLAAALAPYTGKITLLHQEHKGVGAARNLALAHARGDFLTGCDADDLLLPRCIEAMGELAMSRPDLDILVPTPYVELDGVFLGLAQEEKKPPFPVDDLRMGVLKDTIIPIGSGVRRQRLLDIGGFDESLRCAEDYDVWMRLVFSGSRAGVLREPLWTWRLSKGSLSTRGMWCVQGSITAMTKILRHQQLSEAERAIATERVALFRRLLVREEAKAALVEQRPDARRLCMKVVTGPGQDFRARAVSAAAALSPKWAGRRMRSA